MPIGQSTGWMTDSGAYETRRLKKNAPLTGDLKGEPLEFDVLVLAGAREFVVLVVLIDQVLQDRESLPVFLSVIGH